MNGRDRVEILLSGGLADRVPLFAADRLGIHGDVVPPGWRVRACYREPVA